MVSRAEGDWTAASDRRVALYAAWGGACVAILVADPLDPTWRMDQQRAVQVFEGMFTLGLPLAIHGRLARHAPAARRVPVLTHVACFVTGNLVALAVMRIDHADWRWLLGALPIWCLILVGARGLCRSWDRLAGAMAGTMLAAGTTVYWRLPGVFCVPFRPPIPSVETLTTWYQTRATLGLDAQLALTLAGVASGALGGWLVFSGRPAPGADATRSN
jgi:hypothetical protein